MIDADHSGTPSNTIALGRFLRAAQQQVGLAGKVSILITSSEEMRRLNREFRGKNKPTDVLSFPAALNGKAANGKAVIVGDIAISAETARLNAKTLGHSFEAELKILLLHGLLHLAGYDHESDNGQMATREQELRAKLKLPTGLIERSAGKGAASVVPSRSRKNHSFLGGSPRIHAGGGTLERSEKRGIASPRTFAPASKKPRAKAHSNTPLFSAGLKSSSPLLKQGASTTNPSSSFYGTAKAVPFPKTSAKARSNKSNSNGTARVVPFREASRPRSSSVTSVFSPTAVRRRP